MGDSLSKIYIHLVFSTKNRIPTIRKDMLPELWAFATGVLRERQCISVQIGGTTNHLHALFILNKTKSVSEIARGLKAVTSKWYTQKTQNPFEWQTGYAAFSVSPSNVEAVRHYILHQEEHHRHHCFEDEMREIYEKSGTEYNEAYVWG